MIVNREVAAWCGSTPAVDTGQDELWTLLKMCDAVVAAFELESVLTVDSVRLDDWLGDPRREIRLDRPAHATIEATCRRYFGEQGFGPNVSAALVTLEGTTTILEPDGADSIVSAAVSMQGMLTGSNTIWIRTWCDAWLPCGLLGDPQPRRYALNAPRLRRALAHANAVLGGSVAPLPSKIALVSGFEIENLPPALVRPLLGLD